MGAEMDVHYNYNRLRADLTASYTHLLSAKDYYYNDKHIYAVPNFVTNGVFSYKILNKPSHHLWITSNIRFFTNSYIQKVNAEIYEEEKMPANIIFDLGTRYEIGNHVMLRVDCENIFDKTTYMSGAMVVAMPWHKPGRTLMASVKFTL
jgi:outer membrane receptor for ferrienterochelin and colicin